jgi:hypothetical protein
MKYALIIIALLLSSCAAQNPATIQTTTDLNFARTLLAAQTAIDQAKTLVATNPAIKTPLNQVIASYNTAESAYLLYHSAVVAGSSPDATALTAQIAQLSANIVALQGVIK